jgi:hypothetical protein
MRIIKEGVKRVFAKLFECPECHCVFEAERGEYTEKYEEYMGTEYHMICPFCKRNGYMHIKSWEYLKELKEVNGCEEPGQAEENGVN